MKKKTRQPRQRKIRLSPTAAIALGFFFLLPFVTSFGGLDKFRTPKEVFAGVFIVLLAAVFVARRSWRPPPKADAWTLLLGVAILFCFAHAALVGDSAAALRGAVQVLYYSALLLILTEILHADLQAKVWLAAGSAISVNAILTVVQYFGWFPLMERPGGEELAGRLTPAGFIGDVNSGGLLFGLTCLIAIPGIVQPGAPALRAAWAAIFVANLVGLAFTRTLTAILSLSLAMLVWLAFHHWWAYRRAGWGRAHFLRLWLALLVAGVGAGAAAYRAGVVERVSQTAAQMARGDWTVATAGRQPVYQITWRMIQERPLLGRGLNSFGQDFFGYRAETEYGRALKMINQPGAFREVHNEYLQVWEEMGVAGLILFATLFFWPPLAAVRLAFRSQEARESYWAGVLAIAAGFVAVAALTFFPFHLAVTAAYAVLLLACLRRLTAGTRLVRTAAAPEAGSGAGIRRWIKPALAALAAVGLVAGQVGVWRANLELGVAAFLLEQAVAPQVDSRRSRLFADAALGRLDRAGDPGPRLWERYNFRGSASMLLGRHAAAIEWYRRAIRHLPSPETYTNLAAAHMAAGEPSKARPLLETALHYNSSYEPARQALRLLEREGR